ncbi:hypothetical protein [Chryseolinea lacunae]|uniref:GIY-YIG nuclease family protein n=1 Tax=Chryseolinea lacunae TaxID=2801331 RepID=A0ABS1KUS1_9BACT|nr:hypothetical protein [Chryseolinea lacunae]MBL0743048.1 hypothetical protein [Chryseolinea lacunae]
MPHFYVPLEKHAGYLSTTLYHHANNLDGRDNLQTIPEAPAVYLICGRIGGKAANPRMVGETSNLRRSIMACFESPSDDVRIFMQSIKMKELVYELVPELTEAQRMKKKMQWHDHYKPVHDEAIDKIH